MFYNGKGFVLVHVMHCVPYGINSRWTKFPHWRNTSITQVKGALHGKGVLHLDPKEAFFHPRERERELFSPDSSLRGFQLFSLVWMEHL